MFISHDTIIMTIKRSITIQIISLSLFDYEILFENIQEIAQYIHGIFLCLHVSKYL